MTLLRAAAEADRAWLVAVLAHPEVARALAVGAGDTTTAALDRQLAGARDEGVSVLEVDGVPVATARWAVRNRRSRIAVVAGLAVDPGRAGHGHGAALVRALVDHLVTQRDVHRVEAEAFASNTPARVTFERAGFRHEGTRREAYDRGGSWQDSVLLAIVSDQPARSAAVPGT